MTIQPLSEMSNRRKLALRLIAGGVADLLQFGSLGNGNLGVIDLMTECQTFQADLRRLFEPDSVSLYNDQSKMAGLDGFAEQHD